jgi:hypothetical protein
MLSSGYVKTKTRASSSLMAAPRAQRKEQVSDVVEQASERGFQTGSLRHIKLFNMLARILARRLISAFEAWMLTHVTGVSTILMKTAACVNSSAQSFLSDRLVLLSGSLDWRPQVLRPDVCSGVEPGLNLSF